MMWFFAILVVLLLGGIAAVASGYGRPLAEVHDDTPDTVPGAGGSTTGTSPGRVLRGEDLRGVRFPLALRGYRMADVEALLDRLAAQLDEQDPPDHPGGADR